MSMIDSKELISNIEKTLNIRFKNKNILLTAFTHSSFANENKIRSNERLEFLGDAVLELIISEKLFADELMEQEGKLSQMRSIIVSTEPLAKLCEEYGFYKYLRVGLSEQKTKPTKSMMADLMESIIGAVYLDHGFRFTKKFVLRLFNEIIIRAENQEVVIDSKTYLQENYYKLGVKYKTTNIGNKRQPKFKSSVFIGGKVLGSGIASSKRQAEKTAAEVAIKKLKCVQARKQN